MSSPAADDEAEERLTAATAWLRQATRTLPGLRDFDLDEALAALSHEWLDNEGELVHVELHEAVRAAEGTFVIAHGLGDHARRATPLGQALTREGFNAILVDRRGHGLSDGRRGDATLESDLSVLGSAIAHARQRFGGPVVLMGDSLGGIMSWYLLTREPEVEAVVCHCISHPDERHEPAMRLKAPLTLALGRVAPLARIPVTQIADYSQVALEPLTRSYFSDRPDPLFNFSITARAAASYLRFEPAMPWERVRTPVLVTIGSEDRMVTQAHTERCLARAKPPATTYQPLPGLGHQLYLDHLPDALPPLVEWARATLGPAARGAAA